MNASETKQRILAAEKLLQDHSTTREKFESVRGLIKGLNPTLDKALGDCSAALTKLGKLQQGEVIELTAEHLPEQTEEQKNRKKALLWFIKNWKQLKGEVERVKGELEELDSKGEGKTAQQQISNLTKLVAFAKGPLGIITIVAILAVLSLAFLNSQKASKVPVIPIQDSDDLIVLPTKSDKPKISVIIVDGKQIPLSETKIGQGPECMSGQIQASHYHAKDGVAAKALDGSTVADQGGCGYGKVEEVKVVEVEG